MAVNVHNPDQYMTSLRQVLGQGRKRIGLLVGAGAPASIRIAGTGVPLIPTVSALTDVVVDALRKDHPAIDGLRSDLGGTPNIELILSRSRTLGAILGSTKVHGVDGSGYDLLSLRICEQIGTLVNKDLPAGSSPYVEMVNWISGTSRHHAVEIFTTNYDLLFEQALERLHSPYFDGFTGAHEPFFDPSTVANNDLPSRWTRVWKLHGSLGWTANANGQVVRTGGGSSTHLIYPETRKYDQTQKAPYTALFDRLRRFLMSPDTLLISTGFSFCDAHVSAIVDECLAANTAASVFAFQYQSLKDEGAACEIASRRSNMSVYSPDSALINGVSAPWLPGDPPTRDWGPIRSTYWAPTGTGPEQFLLGSFDGLARFFGAVSTAVYMPAPSSAP